MSNVREKIVAIGGGDYAGTAGKGERTPRGLPEIDKEIIKLSGKEKPHFLMLAHAQMTNGEEAERDCCETMRRIYGEIYGCEFRMLRSSDLTEEPEKAREYVGWADIIFESGGDTVALIGLWRRTDFDLVLRRAWDAGKVMCGVSAGATCWFALGNTDAPGYREREVNKLVGLGFIDAYFSPHCQLEWKRKSEISSLRHICKVGLSVSDYSAVEIAGNEYRIIKSAPPDGGFTPYALRTFRKNGKPVSEELTGEAESGLLDDLLSGES